MQGVSQLSLVIEWFGRGDGGKLLIKHSSELDEDVRDAALSLLVKYVVKHKSAKLL